MRPLGKFDLGDQHRFDPVAVFHDGRRYLESIRLTNHRLTTSPDLGG
jgi:hypothetical protein